MLCVMGVVFVIAALGATGCGGNSSVPESGGQDERVVEGTIRQTGGTPNVSTRLETKDGPIILVGPLAAELARAAGAVAEVRGTSAGEAAPDAMRVEAYELVSVDGLSPLVGMLELEDEDLALRKENGQRVELTGGSARMREAAGSKVWVTTRDDGRSIVRWGILKAPGS
jgi:hypothetical protein